MTCKYPIDYYRMDLIYFPSTSLYCSGIQLIFLSLLLKLIRGTEIYYFIFLMIHAADDKGRTMETV